MVKKPTVKELAAELGAAYEVIEYAVPFALRLLKMGGVSLQQQQWFWQAIEQMEEHISLLDDLDDPIDPLGGGPDGLHARHGELLKLLHPESEFEEEVVDSQGT